MLIDYHAHVNFNAYKTDADEVIKRATSGGVFMILVGSQIDTSRRAVALANQYEKGVYAAVGLHPVHLEQMEIDEEEEHFATRAEVFDAAAYRTLAQHPKTVAIGEFGLDYFHIANGRELAANGARISDIKQRQGKTFRQHLDLAEELDLPLILHCRGSIAAPTDAYEDMLAILKEYVDAGKLKRGGAIHCFTSTLPIAERYVALGFHVGFTGVITFKGARPNSACGVSVGQASPYAEVIRGLPLDRILVETDCPYLTPVPYRGKRNEPLYVRYVAAKIAEIKGLSNTETEKQLFENTLRVFSRITTLVDKKPLTEIDGRGILAKFSSVYESTNMGTNTTNLKEENEESRGGNDSTWSALSLAWELGYTIAVPIVVFALGGRLLDRKLETSPWLLLGGIFLSLIVSSWLVYFKMAKIIGK